MILIQTRPMYTDVVGLLTRIACQKGVIVLAEAEGDHKATE